MTATRVRVDVEESEGHEVGFTPPVDGSANVEYLDTVDPAAVEEALLEALDQRSASRARLNR